MPREPLADITEVADFLGLSEAAIYNQRYLGKPPGSLGLKVGGRVRFRWSDVDAYLTEIEDDPAEAGSPSFDRHIEPS